jgi:ATP-dependent phosphoenolpyruvate carboxykinase
MTSMPGATMASSTSRGGCYAKCIRISPETEPDIFNAIKFGSVCENVVLDDKRVADYDDAKYTENTRVAYPDREYPEFRSFGLRQGPPLSSSS